MPMSFLNDRLFLSRMVFRRALSLPHAKNDVSVSLRCVSLYFCPSIGLPSPPLFSFFRATRVSRALRKDGEGKGLIMWHYGMIFHHPSFGMYRFNFLGWMLPFSIDSLFFICFFFPCPISFKKGKLFIFSLGWLKKTVHLTPLRKEYRALESVTGSSVAWHRACAHDESHDQRGSGHHGSTGAMADQLLQLAGCLHAGQFGVPWVRFLMCQMRHLLASSTSVGFF